MKNAKVYIKIDNNNCIKAVMSKVYLKDTSNWIPIAEGHGSEYVHISFDYFGKPLFEEHGIPRYKYINGEVIERTAEEILADIPTPTPTPPSNEELADAIAELAMAIFGGE